MLRPIFAKSWSSAIRSHQSRLKKSSSPSAIRVHAGGDLQRPVVRPHPAERLHRVREGDTGDHEGGAEAERVGEEQDHAARRRRRSSSRARGSTRAPSRCTAPTRRRMRRRAAPPSRWAGPGDEPRRQRALRDRQQPDEGEADHDEDEPGDLVWVVLSTVLAIAAAPAPRITNTIVNPMMNGMLAITIRRLVPRSPSRSTSTAETAAR